MPANLTPEYRAADGRFRVAVTIQDKLTALDQMYASIPKHKGTEKLQADIKRRAAKLRDKLRQAGSEGDIADSYEVITLADMQIALIGPPGSGKSTLLARFVTEGLADQGAISVLTSADAVAVVLDGSDDALLDHLENTRAEIANVKLVIVNKIDLPVSRENLEVLLDSYADEFEIYPVSAITGDGIELLQSGIRTSLGPGNGREIHS